MDAERAQARRVAEYYDYETAALYCRYWDNKHVHFGFFDTEDMPLAAALDRMVDVVLDGVELPRGTTLVDCGCGVGGVAAHIVDRYSATVVGINVSGVQLRMANEAESSHHAQVHTHWVWLMPRLDGRCATTRWMRFWRWNLPVILPIGPDSSARQLVCCDRADN